MGILIKIMGKNLLAAFFQLFFWKLVELNFIHIRYTDEEF